MFGWYVQAAPKCEMGNGLLDGGVELATIVGPIGAGNRDVGNREVGERMQGRVRGYT